MASVLVTGGAGFIGSHLVDEEALPGPRGPRRLSRPQRRDQKSDNAGEGPIGHAAHEGADEAAVDRKKLQGTNLAPLRESTLRHPLVLQGHRIPAPGDLGRHPAEHKVLAVNDQDERGAAFDGRQVREGERDRHEGPRAESQRTPASDVVPDVVLGVLPQVLQGLFGGAKERTALVPRASFDYRLLPKDEGVARLDEHEVHVPIEPVPVADFLRNHDLTLARHSDDVHILVGRVLLHELCRGVDRMRMSRGTRFAPWRAGQ